MSEQSTPSVYPDRLLRVVLQVEDTPENRKTIERVFDYLRQKTKPDISRHAVLKQEQVYVENFAMPNQTKPEFPSQSNGCKCWTEPGTTNCPTCTPK